ncbi:FAD-dependent monooxygenase [Paraglaciecola sp. L3A3]|uniref:FAD-dependent monooxygenase n=1 Tax=Paraglaciecola sp. L3A3 TaxID=2686358 RepID=UPI00131CBD08|nr:FAD-dependent monooxygenase [Paraglaciecola sp. L3A3]
MFDFCVVGGGMVGSAIALGLGAMGFDVALIETNKPADFSASQAPDMRVSAISLTSEKLLTDLGAWSFIEKMRLCEYKRLSVWNKSTCRTDFDCHSVGTSHLGHIVENRIIQLGLHQAIAEVGNIRCFWNQPLVSINPKGQTQLILADGQQIDSKIIIGADGGNSKVRQASNIGVQGWQYAQQALGITIKTDIASQDITWQQFTANGPLAFLPLYDGYGSLVWYNSVKNIKWLKTLSNEKLKQQIIQVFPDELVDFEVLSTASFGLTRMHANQYYKHNSVLIGDAAHTINPLAGQGVNLGFKDVGSLLTQLASCVRVHGRSQALTDTNRQLWLNAYEKDRRTDNLIMMTAMDSLYAIFSNDNTPLSLLRNLGLKLANSSGPLKKQALKYAMGLV